MSTPSSTDPKLRPTKLEDLEVGDLIYVHIIIDKADIPDPNSKTTTTKKVKSGEPVRRLCVVLESGSTVKATYFATFDNSTTLPTALDKRYWYPIEPSMKEGSYDPLPALNDKAQWACLRHTHIITDDPVSKLVERLFLWNQ